MAIQTYEKHPASVLDYGFDLTRWLQTGESIASVDAVVEEGDIVEVTTDTDGKKAAVFLGAGTNKSLSKVTLSATTNNSPARVFAKTIAVYVTDHLAV